MSLHPITKSRRTRKARGAYRSFHSRQEWKPWIGWNYHVSKNPLDWFGRKKFVLGIVSLAIIIGGLSLANGPLFHGSLPFLPSNNHFIDPVTTIWKVTAPTADLAEFNYVRVAYVTQAFLPGIAPSFALQANGTQAAVALTKLPIGDLGIVAAKQMFYRAQFRTAGLCCGG